MGNPMSWTVVEFVAHHPYDGCFWEYNYVLLDREEKRVLPLYVSASDMLVREWNKEYRCYVAVGIIKNLYDEVLLGIKERQEDGYYVDYTTCQFQEAKGKDPSRYEFPLTLLPAIIEGFRKTDLPYFVNCGECGREVDVTDEAMEIGDYRGNGGVGIEVESMLCYVCALAAQEKEMEEMEAILTEREKGWGSEYPQALPCT